VAVQAAIVVVVMFIVKALSTDNTSKVRGKSRVHRRWRGGDVVEGVGGEGEGGEGVGGDGEGGEGEGLYD